MKQASDKLALVIERMKRSRLAPHTEHVREVLRSAANVRHGVPVEVERAGGRTAPNGEAYHVKIKASTNSVARDAGIIPLSAWQDGGLRNFDANPVIQPFHDYTQLPIAKSVYHEIDPDAGALIEYWRFHDETELSRQMHRMYDSGYMRAASVGFIVKDFEFVDEEREAALQDELGTRDPIYWLATRAELLETSAVPVPADPGALAFEHALTNSRAHGDDVTSVARMWNGMKRAVPSNVSSSKAPEGEAWNKPSLSDFTDKGWDDLSDAEKRHIAGHYAYAKEMPPKTFGDLKLPHHRAKDGAVVWHGVSAAMNALMGGHGGVDLPDSERRAVYDHLAHHYRQFDKEPPEFRGATMDKEQDQEGQGDNAQSSAQGRSGDTDSNAMVELEARIMARFDILEARVATFESREQSGGSAAAASGNAEGNSDSGNEGGSERSAEIEIAKKDGETDEQAVSRHIDEIVRRTLGAPVSTK